MHSVLFVNPLGDLCATFKVLWLSRDDVQSLDQVREMIEAKWQNSARGIVWKDGSYGVRFSPDDCREHR
eukprot:1948275-Amphidinium_carterae.1